MSEQDINPKPKSRKGCIIQLLIGLVFLFILAALAIPDFMKMTAKSPSTAENYLAKIYSAQKTYHKENGRYAGHEKGKKCFELIQWDPEGHSPYYYYCDTDVFASKRIRKNECPVPEVPPVTENSFTIFAVANIDNDPACDVWSINDQGDIYNLFNDVSNKKRIMPKYRINATGEKIKYYSDLNIRKAHQPEPQPEKDHSPEIPPSENR